MAGIIVAMKLRMRKEERVARMREYAYIILVDKPYAKRPLSKPKRRWQDNLNWSRTEWENTAGFNWPRRRTLGSLWIWYRKFWVPYQEGIPGLDEDLMAIAGLRSVRLVGWLFVSTKTKVWSFSCLAQCTSQALLQWSGETHMSTSINN